MNLWRSFFPSFCRDLAPLEMSRELKEQGFTVLRGALPAAADKLTQWADDVLVGQPVILHPPLTFAM